MASRLNKIVPRIQAEAAVWVMELHAPDRNADLEARVRQWLAEDPNHAAAFEIATDDWQASGNIPRHLWKRAPLPGSSRKRSGRKRTRTTGVALAGMAIVCLGIAWAVYFLRNDTLATGPAEQRIVDLSDGSQVTLNANSRVVIRFDDGTRKVILAKGEALFDVAKDRSRPFVVIAGDRKIIAMGTSFEVRREEPAGSAFAVILLEGQVAIEPVAWPDAPPGARVHGVKLLNPGQRLRFTGDTGETLDSPSIERITAWRRGRLIFDNASLGEAAAEFNRYGTHKLIIDDPAARNQRVGGVFQINDPYSFAQSMAETYGLRIVTRGKTIILTGKPDSNDTP